ncbi:MAG: PD40 domain-containing protein [Sedimentisphaerales bacterium]|nr:PD40 domain-containing protein [Sedimentisphaerales bacterium]
MIKLKQKILLVLSALLLTTLAGCLPEDKADFSDDGSVGVAKISNNLYLIDGQNNTAKIIDQGELQIGPSITADGKMIAYAKNEFFKNPDQLDKLLPEDQLSVIKQYIRDISALIIADGGVNKDKIEKGTLFPRMQSGQFAGLVFSLIALQADQALLDLLKPDELKLAQAVKEQGFKLCHLYVTTLDGLNIQNKQTIYISCFSMISPKISPDGKSIAYLIQDDFRDDDNITYNLHVATLDGKIKAAQVAPHTAFGGYAWSPDSTKLAFIKNESPGQKDDFMLGTLSERQISDKNGQLDVKLAQDRQNYNSIATHYCQGKDTELAGMVFYPWLSATYHPSGRIFFSTTPITLPAGELQRPENMSVFCYDPLLKTVTDVLPQDISAQLSTSVINFEISPDGKKLLLPLQKQRFMIYTLGQTKSIEPLTDADAFGDENALKMAPAFKGNNQITCLVEKDSHFFKDFSPDSLKDQEIAILDTQGKFVNLLTTQP